MQFVWSCYSSLSEQGPCKHVFDETVFESETLHYGIRQAQQPGYSDDTVTSALQIEPQAGVLFNDLHDPYDACTHSVSNGPQSKPAPSRDVRYVAIHHDHCSPLLELTSKPSDMYDTCMWHLDCSVSQAKVPK